MRNRRLYLDSFSALRVRKCNPPGMEGLTLDDRIR